MGPRVAAAVGVARVRSGRVDREPSRRPPGDQRPRDQRPSDQQQSHRARGRRRLPGPAAARDRGRRPGGRPRRRAPSTPTSGCTGSAAPRSSCATPASSPPRTPTRWGSRCGCSTAGCGASPPTSTSRPRPPPPRPAAPSTSPRPSRPSPARPSRSPRSRSTPTRPGSRPTTSTPSPSTRASGSACSPTARPRCSPRRGSTTSRRVCLQVKEQTFYADLAGTVTTQQRVRVDPGISVTAVDRDGGGFESLRTVAPPAGRGWEYLTGTGWDWDAELAELPELLAEKLAAPSVTAGPTDLVIDPTNLWLVIHESIGHATEYDRAIGYEAAYAGTSFATPDLLGTLRYGSERPARHGRPDGAARPGERRLRRRRRVHRRDRAVRPDPRRRARRLPGRPVLRAAPRPRRAPTAAPTPTPRATSRCSGWRTCRWAPTRRPTRAPRS